MTGKGDCILKGVVVPSLHTVPEIYVAGVWYTKVMRP